MGFVLPVGQTCISFRPDHIIGVLGRTDIGWNLWDGKSLFRIRNEIKPDNVFRTLIMMLCENTEIVRAFRQANEARFEHGETPKV